MYCGYNEPKVHCSFQDDISWTSLNCNLMTSLRNSFIVRTLMIIIIFIWNITLRWKTGIFVTEGHIWKIKQWSNSNYDKALECNIYFNNYISSTMHDCLNRLKIKRSLSRCSCKIVNYKIEVILNRHLGIFLYFGLYIIL